MTDYIHHGSGHLRIKYAQLRNNRLLARQTEAALWKIDGVISAEVSTVTGSLLIRYDTFPEARERILNAIGASSRALGLSDDRAESHGAPAQPGASLATRMGEKLAGAAVEKAIERLALLALGALR